MSDEKSTTISISPTPIDPIELRRQYQESLIPPPPPKFFYPIATFILVGCVVAAIMTVIGVLATYGVHSSKSTDNNTVNSEICRLIINPSGGFSLYATTRLTINTPQGSFILTSNTTYHNGDLIGTTTKIHLNLTQSNGQVYINNQAMGCSVVNMPSSASSSSTAQGITGSSVASSTVVMSSTGDVSPSSSSSSTGTETPTSTPTTPTPTSLSSPTTNPTSEPSSTGPSSDSSSSLSDASSSSTGV